MEQTLDRGPVRGDASSGVLLDDAVANGCCPCWQIQQESSLSSNHKRSSPGRPLPVGLWLHRAGEREEGLQV